MQEPATLEERLERLWPLPAGAAILAVHYAMGRVFLNGFALDLGSVLLPGVLQNYFLSIWNFLGLLASGLFAAGLLRALALSGGAAEWAERWGKIPERPFLAAACALGFLIPALLRKFVLLDTALLDDDSAYRFMAELLAGGRLYAASHPLRDFFDRGLMINDGKLYAQYFLGFPALQVPFVVLGIPGYANSFYSALAVPAVYFTAKRLAGKGWAQAAAVLYLSSPMLQLCAAMELPYTSCLASLAWATWFYLRSKDEAAPAWAHFGLGLAFSIAFFVRPISALGVGAPFLAAWFFHQRKKSGGQFRRAALALAVPCAVLAVLFLSANKAQNGSYGTTSYARLISYNIEKQFRFAGHNPSYYAAGGDLRKGALAHPVPALARAGLTLFRLDRAFLGWPLSLLFIWFAWDKKRAALWWLSGASFLLVHIPAHDGGIDLFGPAHAVEVGWPVLMLTVLGLKQVTERLKEIPPPASGPPPLRQYGELVLRSEALLRRAAPLRGVAGDRRGEVHALFPLPAALMAAFVLTALAGYWPVQVRALHRAAGNARMPEEKVRESGLENAVVFAPRPFATNCRSAPVNFPRFWRPNNDPDLGNSVLWLNHLTVEKDRAALGEFPGRAGYVMLWRRDCRVELLALGSRESDAAPAGFTGPGSSPQIPRCPAPWACFTDAEYPSNADAPDPRPAP